MKISEKSLELNVGAELLYVPRTRFGMRKAYLPRPIFYLFWGLL